MANSFAQTLAGGTQDLAALAGLFCTDGVERNALSVQSGYFGIAASSLSLLGILGLVRSAIKVALGLRRCSNAGFNLDSLRGLYGYLLEESEEQKNRIECDYTEVAFGKTKSVKNGKVAIDTHIGNDKYDHVVIRRKKRFFDPQLTPIVNVGSDWPEKLYSKTVVNLGNLQREKSVSQSPILIGLLLFLCPEQSWVRVSKPELLLKASTQNGPSILNPCNLHVFNQQGDRIHLQPIGGKCPDNCSFLIGPNAENKSSALEDKDSWRYLLDRSRKVRNLFKDHFFDKIPWQSVNTWGDALWTVATPGITDRRDNVHPAHATTTRTWGNGNNGNMTGAIEFVQEYIKDGVQSASVKKRGNGRGGNKTEVIENV
ncbi:hypothetical protein TUN199_04369 [Pyrenophora tritici-repentis]|nr:hypothetical protein Alg215_07834 [Pyrenophora tritici-repentis]KAI0587959.1 hypothetical protein Alg130_03574 [Pyrenophora tritici-repentis]KAI0612228.1 hypothetical protein TUN205_03524 [Pyrenophora tritici-repentis]KAI0623630.1 hypothetical protein TUN199_04369 [Pyrenophora tritici-repentis]PZD26658.1 hypothetical protein A1F96_07380 [Pyrenophora tritici-repentis]